VRILHIGKYYQPFSGGIENFMKALMEESVSQGHQVAAIVHDHTGGELSDFEVCSNVDIYRAKSLGQFLYAPIAPSIPSLIRRVILSYQPDILHLHMPNLTVFFLLLMSVAKKIPWVVHWHSDVEFNKDQFVPRLAYTLFYSKLESKVLKAAKRIIVTSPPYLETSKALLPFVEKCSVIPLGLAPDEKKENGGEKQKVPDAHDADKVGVIKLLTVGRLSYYKGHKTLLAALSQISQVANHFQLDIVGTGECESLLLAQIKDLRLDKCVRLRGYISDEKIDQYFHNCDIFCLPSINRSEAFGLVLLEAFRAGKPCLVSNVTGSGMNWVVGDGVEGWHFKQENVESLIEMLSYLASHPKTISELGDNARKRYNMVFKIDQIYRLIDQEYLLVLNSTQEIEA